MNHTRTRAGRCISAVRPNRSTLKKFVRKPMLVSGRIQSTPVAAQLLGAHRGRRDRGTFALTPRESINPWLGALLGALSVWAGLHVGVRRLAGEERGAER